MITTQTVRDHFQAPTTENPYAGDPWWQLQALGLLAATQILRLTPDGESQQNALSHLLQAIRIASSTVEMPPDEVRRRRMAQTLAPYVPTYWDVVDAMLNLAQLASDDVLVDLGSGDGRIVFRAASRFGVRAIGYEIDEDLYTQSLKTLDQWSFFGPVLPLFYHRDAVRADLSEATVVTTFLTTEGMKALAPTFATMKPGSRIVTHQFPIAGRDPDRIVSKFGSNILLYRN